MITNSIDTFNDTITPIKRMEINRSKMLPPKLNKLFRDFLVYTDRLNSAIAQLEAEYEITTHPKILEQIEKDIDNAVTNAKPRIMQVGIIINNLHGINMMKFFCHSCQPKIQGTIEVCWNEIGLFKLP